jgi:hypothetical protein
MSGWLLVSPGETKLMKSIQGLPKTLAGVLRGEDKDVSSALVESSAAGARVSASSARFSGELEAREVGQRWRLLVTLTLLVGCSADLPDASAVYHRPHATVTTDNLEVDQVLSATRAGADCARGPVTWEAEEAMKSMVLPLVQRLNETYHISLDSRSCTTPTWHTSQCQRQLRNQVRRVRLAATQGPGYCGAPLWQLRTMQVPLFLRVLGGSAHISHFVHLLWRDSPCGVLCVCREVGLGCRTREQEDCARPTAFMLPWCSHAQNPSHRTPARTPHAHTSKHTTHT